MFFQLVERDGTDGKRAGRFERWGCVSQVGTPTREEVIREIPAEHARGEWVEWHVEIKYCGERRTSYYAAFERELEPAVKCERVERGAKEQAATKRAPREPVERNKFAQLRMEM